MVAVVLLLCLLLPLLRTFLPWLVALRSSDGCRCGSVMVVAPIAGTSLPCIAASGTLREGTSQQPTESRNETGSETPLLLSVVIAESVHGCGMVAVGVMVAFALVLPDLTEETSQQPTEGKEPQQGNRNALALWLCDVCCSHCCEHSCLGCSGTHRGKEPEAATEGTESTTRKSQRLCPCASVMSVAPIVANVLALVASGTLRGNEPRAAREGKESQQGNHNGLALVGCLCRKRPRLRKGCRSSDGCPCLGCSGTLRGKEPEAATKGKESQQGNRNALALVGVRSSDGCRCLGGLPELSEGTESQRGNRNALALSELFPESVHGCRNGCRSSDVCPCGSVMSVAPIDANALALVMSIDANAFALALVVPELSERERAKSRNKAGKNIVLQLVV